MAVHGADRIGGAAGIPRLLFPRSWTCVAARRRHRCDEGAVRPHGDARVFGAGRVSQIRIVRSLLAEASQASFGLIAKLPNCIRYTKQQLNFWRDLSWHLTIGHARDWLSQANLSKEVREGVAAFNEKRAPDYDRMRDDLK